MMMSPEIRKMAEDAGLFDAWGDGIYEGEMNAFLEAFARLVAEDCAKEFDCILNPVVIMDVALSEQQERMKSHMLGLINLRVKAIFAKYGVKP